MFKDLYTYLNEGVFYYGLEISENREGLSFHILEIQRKKQELFVTREETHASLEETVNQLKKNAPVFLVVNTNQVLTKIIEPSKSVSDEVLVHNAFPNLDFKTFYYELTRSKKSLLISICLKENVDALLNDLQGLNVNLINFSIGISPITSISGFLEDGMIRISNSQVQVTDKAIEKFIPTTAEENQEESAYDINGIMVKNNFLLSFSSILKHLMKAADGVSNFTEYNLNLKKEFKNRRYFTVLLRTSLMLVLGTLLVNFLFFNHYFDKVNTLHETLAVNNVNKNQLIKLQDDVRKKEEKIRAILSTSNSRSTFLVDEIVKKMPLSIVLFELEYQPLIKPLRDGKEVEILYNKIVVSGQARDSQEYYQWVERLENKSWIKKIETTDYDYANKNMSNFSFKIEFNEERN